MDAFLVFLRRHVRPGSNLDASTPMLSSGLIDSFHLAELLVSIEDEYGVVIPVNEIGVDNFDTPEQMLRFVSFLRGKG